MRSGMSLGWAGVLLTGQAMGGGDSVVAKDELTRVYIPSSLNECAISHVPLILDRSAAIVLVVHPDPKTTRRGALTTTKMTVRRRFAPDS